MIPADVACVVLASGSSQRFGKANKLEADLCGRPVLDHALDTVKAVGFGETFIVSQGDCAANCRLVKNDRPEKGQGYALRLGLRAAKSSGWTNVCVVLGDMPLVSVSHLKDLVGKMTLKQSVISQYEDQNMPPVGFHMEAINMILAEKSESGGRDVFDQFYFQTIPLSKEAALDVDTREDLTRVSEIMKRQQK